MDENPQRYIIDKKNIIIIDYQHRVHELTPEQLENCRSIWDVQIEKEYSDFFCEMLWSQITKQTIEILCGSMGRIMP